MSAEERSLTLLETQQELFDAMEAAEGGDEAALTILDHYLEGGKSKVDRVAFFLNSFDEDIEVAQFQIEQRERQIEQLKALIQQKKNEKKRAQDRVLYALDVLGQKQFVGQIHKLVSCGMGDLVEVKDQARLPAKYIIVETKPAVEVQKPNMDALKRDLKAGIEIPGADLKINRVRLAVRTGPVRASSTTNQLTEAE